jgi:AraC-like DNA-binding protein
MPRVNRKKRTSRDDILVTYRELAPSPALRGYVRAYFVFTPGDDPWFGSRSVTHEVGFTPNESFCAPLLADAHASLVVDLGATCQVGQGWTLGTPVRAQAIGAQQAVAGAVGNARSAMIGAYLEPGSTSALFDVPAAELTDRVVNLDDLWGLAGARVAEDLVECGATARVDRFERALLERVGRARAPRTTLDIPGLVRWIRSDPTRMTVGRLADAAGVSRRHLTRVFHEIVGVSPKRYCRLARFRAGLAYAGAGAGVKWAQVAAELGYADQSHMIAEFRRLSSLTPEALATGRWFHPFILDARARRAATVRP